MKKTGGKEFLKLLEMLTCLGSYLAYQGSMVYCGELIKKTQVFQPQSLRLKGQRAMALCFEKYLDIRNLLLDILFRISSKSECHMSHDMSKDRGQSLLPKTAIN